jgi:signal transduction histidine kinase/GAF domain-containing protein
MKATLLLKVINQISDLFSLHQEVDVIKILQIISEYFSENTNSYIYFFNDEYTRAIKSYQWINKESTIVEGMDLSHFSWSISKLKNKEIIAYSDAEKIPDEGVNEKNILKGLGIKSFIIVPIFSKLGKLKGNIGLTLRDFHKEWTDDDIEILQTISKLLNTFFENKETENQLCYNQYLEKSLEQISLLLISDESIDLNNVLKIITQSLNCKIGLIFFFSSDYNYIIKGYQWTKESVNLVENIPANTYSWSISKLKNRESIILSDIEQFPEEANSEKEESKKLGLKSLISLPIISKENKVMGFIGFLDSIVRNWTDEELRIVRVISIMITNHLEKVKFSEELISSTKQLEEAQQIANIGSWQWKTETNKVTWSNHLYQIFGLSPETFSPTIENIADRIHPDDKNLFMSNLNNSVESKHALFNTYRIIKADNKEVRFIESKGQFLSGSNNKFIIGTSQDVTERKNYEEKIIRLNEELELKVNERTKDLQSSNEELQNFAYMASHDLQAPLRTISSYLSLLKRRYKDKFDSEANEFINFAIDGAKMMSNLLSTLLSYAKIEKGNKRFSEIDCNNIIESVIHHLNPIIYEKGAVIKYDNLPIVTGDNIQFIQLFQNLIMNAIKYSYTQPIIEITAKESEHFWLFSVKDNGIGIPEKYLKSIFEIFKRINSEDSNGNGLGLAICKKIVERHNGKVWVESEPNKGSTFYFTVPI